MDKKAEPFLTLLLCSILVYSGDRGFVVERVDNISDKSSPILLSGHRASVALPTIIQRKGNVIVADTAVLSTRYLEH